MPYRHTVGTATWQFADLRALMAKATPARSGDVLAGLAAPSVRPPKILQPAETDASTPA